MKFLKCLFFLLFPILTYAQQNEGIIVYEETVDLHRRLTGDRERFKQFVPKTRSSKFELKFNSKASMFKEYIDDSEDPGPNGGRRRRFRFFGGGAEGEMYRNFENQTFVNSREFEGKNYLIKGDIVQTPWKVTGKTRDIDGYACMQAIYDDTLEERALTAWFTPQIPVAAGPSRYGQLPGLIIALDINNGEIVFRPVKIEFKELKDNAIKEPKKGKEIERKEFEKLVRKRMEEMRAQRRAQGGNRSSGNN